MQSLNRTLSRGTAALPVIVRVIIGSIMLAHGWQKLTVMGASNFGNGMLADLGVPLPVAFGYIVTYAELIGGALLIVGLFTRLTALVLTAILAGAIILVKADIGLIGGGDAPLPGAEIDLALIAGLLVSALIGPGKPSIDHALGLESDATSIDLTTEARTPADATR